LNKHCLLLLLCFMLYTIPAADAALDTNQIDGEAIVNEVAIQSELPDLDNSAQREPSNESEPEPSHEPNSDKKDDQANAHTKENIKNGEKDTEEAIDENPIDGTEEDTGEKIDDTKKEPGMDTPPTEPIPEEINNKPEEVPVIQELPRAEFYKETNLIITPETQIEIELSPHLNQLSPVIQGGEHILIEIFSDYNLVGRIENGIVTYAIDFLPNNVYITITGSPGADFNVIFKFTKPESSTITGLEIPAEVTTQEGQEEQISEEEILPEEQDTSQKIDIVFPGEQNTSDEKDIPQEEPSTSANSEENAANACGNNSGNDNINQNISS